MQVVFAQPVGVGLRHDPAVVHDEETVVVEPVAQQVGQSGFPTGEGIGGGSAQQVGPFLPRPRCRFPCPREQGGGHPLGRGDLTAGKVPGPIPGLIGVIELGQAGRAAAGGEVADHQASLIGNWSAEAA